MKKYIIIVLFFCFQGLFAQVQFEAKVSKTTIGLNERLRIDFAMNADGDNFMPPSFEGFRVIAGPSQQVSQSWINGKSSFNKMYSYYLVPTAKGTFTIKQASIEINNQVYKTSPVKIVVSSAVEEPRDGNNAVISADDNLHLVAEVTNGSPYLNEPITVVYKLYFSDNIGIRGLKDIDLPKYKDFWSQNIEIKNMAPERANYNGSTYRYIVLKKVVLYPQKSGLLTIVPLSIDVAVELPTNRRDMFGGMITTTANKTVSAGGKTINVKALPENGKPADFSGAVGKFDFRVKASKTELKHGESLDLDVSVSGTGNLKLFSLPKPVVPSALEMYDPVHTENVNVALSGMQGKIADKYTVIPQYQGDYSIKPMSFTYFDLTTKTYKTITSPEIGIKVLDGPVAAAPAVAGNEEAGSEADKNQLTKSDQFRFIDLKTTLVSAKKEDFFGSGLFYGLLLTPFLGIPLLILTKRKKEAIDRDVVGNRIKRNNKLARKFLSEAKKQLNNKELFYISLEKAMHNFLKAKLNIETSEMSKDKIREILVERNANPETVHDFIQLTENCEFARYAPSSPVAIQQDYDKALVIISALEKSIK